MSSSAWEVVRTTTGMSFRSSSALISASTSRPSFLGRFRSSRIRSGRTAPLNSPSPRRYDRASTPSRTTFKWFQTRPDFRASRVKRTSPALSSTKRISTGPAVLIASPILLHPSFLGHDSGLLAGSRNTEEKRRSMSGFGLHPDLASVALYNFFADGEPDASAGKLFGTVQALEEGENALVILRLHANAVIPHRKDPAVSFPDCGNVHPGRVRAPEFDAIADQVLKELHQLGGIRLDYRQFVVTDQRTVRSEEHTSE